MRKLTTRFRPHSRAVLLTLGLATACGSPEDLRSVNQDHRSRSKDGDALAAGKTGAVPGEPVAASAMTYETMAELPACDATRDGHIAYVATAKELLACAGGTWTEVDLRGEKGDPGTQGEKGDQGEPGAAGAAGSGGTDNAALALYKTYRNSVFRVSLGCRLIANPPATCNGKAAQVGAFGTAFLCGDGVACTNQHVAVCGLDPCYRLDSLAMQAVEGESDSVNGDGTPAAPFFTTASDAAIKRHPTRDLARVSVTGVPSGAKPMPLATKPHDASVSVLAPVLSMSFPLGFQDLYTDVGAVNSRDLGECDTEGGGAGYGCPKALYDFATSNDTDHGSSGSPLLDVASGLVIGVTSAGTEGENANYTWAIDASLLDF